MLLAPVFPPTLRTLLSSKLVENSPPTIYVTHVAPGLINRDDIMEFLTTETFQQAGTFEEALCHHLIRQGMGLRLPSKNASKILMDYTPDTSEGQTKLL
jgi:hypothetical protein